MKPTFFRILLTLLPLLFGVSCATSPSLDEFSNRAQKSNLLVSVPDLNVSSQEIEEQWSKAKDAATKRLDNVGAQDLKNVTFESTLETIEHIYMDADNVVYPIYLIWNTSPDKNIRDAAQKIVEDYDKWQIEQSYREDVYKVVEAFSKKNQKLSDEDQRLLEETMKGYRQLGLHLPKSTQKKVKKIKEELSKLGIDFDNNIKNAIQTVRFSKAELEGVPQDYLDKWKVKDKDLYEFDAKLYSNYAPLIQNAKNEEVRKKVAIERMQTAMKENMPILQKVIEKRAQLAALLGYKTWAHLKLELKMAKNPKAVLEFLDRLDGGLTPKLQSELEEIRQKKAKVTKNPKAKLTVWDTGYYFNMISKEKYEVDTEEIKQYFPMQASLDGMFKIYEQIFGLTFHEVTPPYKWVDDIQLYAVEDSATKTPLGLFYLDLYPREGKYGHFAQFTLIKAGMTTSGAYRRPTVALICNFPKPTDKQPSLLSHSDLETLFHEFGHAMHSIMTTANHSSFSGTSVPGDFVEAPSQMLENWAWDKTVLDTFARHYKDSSKKFPDDLLERMKKVDNASKGRDYKYQLGVAQMDMKMHSINKGTKLDVLKMTNDVFERSLGLPLPPNTASAARIGHFMGYDAGYYGYLWAESISEDLASVFKNAPNGFLDKSVGMRLRQEIYAPGNSRKVSTSIESFLGRERSLEPFFEKLNVTQEKELR